MKKLFEVKKVVNKNMVLIAVAVLLTLTVGAFAAAPLFADDTVAITLETVPGLVQTISNDVSVEIKEMISDKNDANVVLDVWNSSDKKAKVSVNGRNIIVLPEEPAEISVLYSDIKGENLTIKTGKVVANIPVAKWDARFDMPDPLNVVKRERKVLEVDKKSVTAGVYLNATFIGVNENHVILKVKAREDYLKIDTNNIKANQEMFLPNGSQFGLDVEGDIIKTIDSNGAVEIRIPYNHYEDIQEYNMSVDVPVNDVLVTVMVKDFTRK
jgi:hypothetical protein